MSNTPIENSTPPRLFFRQRDRLTKDLEYQAVFDAKLRKHAGPLTLFSKPNHLGHHRLGLSIGRRVGNAVQRNRLKRRLREAFRLTRHTWPSSYDLVIVARAHPTKPTPEYADTLTKLVCDAHEVWAKRTQRTSKQPKQQP